MSIWSFAIVPFFFNRSDLSQVVADVRMHSTAMATHNGAADSEAALISDTLQRMGLPAVSTAGTAMYAFRAFNFISLRE